MADGDYNDTQTNWNGTGGGCYTMGGTSTIILAGSISVVAIVGVLGNLLTVHTFVSTEKMHTSGNFLLVSLSISDTCTLLSGLMAILSRFLLGEVDRDNTTLCKIPIYLLIMSGLISVNHLPVISFNRYFIITQNRALYMRCWSKHRTALLVASVWVLPVILLVSPSLGFGMIDFVPEIGGCALVETTSSGWWYSTVLNLNTVVSCGLITPVFYILTFKKIRSIKNRVRDAQSVEPAATLRPSALGFSREELALTRMTLMAFCCFVICWMPNFVLHLSTFGATEPRALSAICKVLALSNSTLNPFIYVGTNRNFRREFGRKNIFRCFA